MKYQFPARIPLGRTVVVTQGFGDVHKAIDCVFTDTPEDFTSVESGWQTYGTPIVCPFPTARMITREIDVPEGEKGSIFQVQYDAPDGMTYILGGLHCSEIVDEQLFEFGQTIAYVGNNGIHQVTPSPTPAYPARGSHIHLSLNVNIGPQPNPNVPVDPLDYFDTTRPFRGNDTGIEKDTPAYLWAIGIFREAIKNLFSGKGS